jgi:hypothetical protein
LTIVRQEFISLIILDSSPSALHTQVTKLLKQKRNQNPLVPRSHIISDSLLLVQIKQK